MGCIIKFTHGFGRFFKSRVISVYYHLCDHGKALAFFTTGRQFIIQGLLDLITDGTLGVCYDVHQGHQMQTGFPPGHFGPQHDKPHLRAVAV